MADIRVEGQDRVYPAWGGLIGWYATGGYWIRRAITLVPSGSYTCNSVKIRLGIYYGGQLAPDPVTLSLCSGLDGAVLQAKTLNWGDYDEDGWWEYVWDSPVELTEGTTYSLVASSTNVGGYGEGEQDYVGWNLHAIDTFPPDQYPQGTNYTEFGSGWTATPSSATHKFNFQTWGTGFKAKNPTPANTADDVSLAQQTVTWEDGGGSGWADSFDVYYGTESGNLTKVSSEQDGTSFTIWNIDYGSPFLYEQTRYWRIDSNKGDGTVEGDEWVFTSMAFRPPGPVYFDPDEPIYWTPTPPPGEDPAPGPTLPDDPDDYEEMSNPNIINTSKRLTCAANNKIWYESL